MLEGKGGIDNSLQIRRGQIGRKGVLSLFFAKKVFGTNSLEERPQSTTEMIIIRPLPETYEE